MKPYIYGERNGIYIIDLHQTLKGVEAACDFINQVVGENKPVLFVGTKKQAQESVAAAAERCGMFYVTQRWLGGMLTNWQTIRQRINRLRQLREMEAEGVFALLPKKESARLQEEMGRLELILGGVKNMPSLPGAMFIVDTKEEHIAVQEAHRLAIPIVAIVDTNCDPDEVDHIIPGNDDAIRAIKLIADKIADAVLEVKQGREQALVEEVREAERERAAREEKPVAEEKAPEPAEEKPEWTGEPWGEVEGHPLKDEGWPEEEESEGGEGWSEDEGGEGWSEDEGGEGWSEDEDEEA
jgi:small subunit ribosomal protein S2